MTYHLKPDGRLSSEVHGVAEDQLAGAIAAIEGGADLHERAHDLRKRMKRLRGLLRLVRPVLGEAYGRENREFRDIARLFSNIRDGQVLSDTLERLAPDGEDARALAPLRDWAARRRETVLAARYVEDRMSTAAARLRKARARLPAWVIEGDTRKTLRGGLKKTYGRARDCHFAALEAPGDDVLFHQWRKRVKYHWYHCRLLRAAWPEAMRARIGTLDALSGALGDDHDLVVLRGVLKAEADGALPPGALQRADALCTGKSAALRHRAFALAGRVMAEDSHALAHRLTQYWVTAPMIAAAARPG